MRTRIGAVLLVLLVWTAVGWAEDCPKVIGGLPDGPATAVEADGSRAFLGRGAIVQVLDVSDPAAPQNVGRVNVATDVKRIVVDNDLVFVAARWLGLTILDASDASAPVIASRITIQGDPNWNVAYHDVAVVEQTAFVAAGLGGLHAFDIHDPEHPVQIGAVEASGYAVGVATSASHAFVGSSDRLVVVDISVPDAISVVHEMYFGAKLAQTVFAVGNTLYTAGQDGMRVFDISDPASPTEMGSVDWSTYSGSIRDLDVRGDLAYVADQRAGVRVIDVSDPTDPRPVGLIGSPPYPEGVAVLEEGLLVAAWDAGLRTYDVSIPASPVEIGSVHTPTSVVAVAVDGDRGVALARDGLRVLDMTDPTEPVEIGAYHPAEVWGTECLDLAGNHAFVCDMVDDRVIVLDISNANAVEPVAEIDARRPTDIEVVPPYAYIQAAELLIIDVSDPTRPNQVAAMEGVGQYLAVELPYLYGTGWTEGLPFAGLTIVDVSDPVHPQTVGGAFAGDINCCSRAAVSESWVYVLDYQSEGYLLNVVDARDPANPAIVGDVYFGHMSDVAVSGSSGLLGIHDGPVGAVLELDLTYPVAPTVVGRRATPGMPRNFALSDGFWYVPESAAGFEVFEPCNTGLQKAVWLEIAAHGPGKSGSEWRTDVVVRNLGAFEADLELTLHLDGAEHELTNSVVAGAQAVFEDVVGIMGVDGKGALEVRSSQPLSAIGRIYTEDDLGTFGQSLQGTAALDGLSADEVGWLHGLRQFGQLYRTNISVTNAGHEDAMVRITLFDSDGGEITAYDLGPIEPGGVVQDLEPLADRASRPDIGWAMAKIEVVAGGGVLASASVIDSRTNDPTTIPLVVAEGSYVRASRRSRP